MCAPKFNMLDNWDTDTVPVDKVLLPTIEANDILLMKLTLKKSNYKDAVTEYLSSNLYTILLDNICIVINNGLSKPYIVPKVGHPPPFIISHIRIER